MHFCKIGDRLKYMSIALFFIKPFQALFISRTAIIHEMDYPRTKLNGISEEKGIHLIYL